MVEAYYIETTVSGRTKTGGPFCEECAEEIQDRLDVVEDVFVRGESAGTVCSRCGGTLPVAE